MSRVRRFLTRAAAALLFATLGTSVSAAPLSCTRQAVTALASEALAQVSPNPEPGVTLAVYYPTRWSSPVAVARGLSDYAAHRPMQPDSPMLAGSIGKTFFGAAALNLAEAGKLDLDRPIAAYLPDAAIPNADRVTARMLLSHTSGYGEYDGSFMEDLIRQPLRMRTLSDWLGPLRRNAPGAPGTFRYSDINFVLLAELVSATSGEPWDRYIAREFLRPFGLRRTAAALSPRISGLAPGYAGPENFFGRDAMMQAGRLIYNPQFESGGGGYVSTASDLAKWIVRLGAANAYSPRSWAAASTPTHPVDDKGRTYGLGIHIDRTAQGTAYGHSGYIPGYVSWVRYYADAGIGVAIQTNTSDPARLPWDGYDVMDRLVGQLSAACH